MSNLVEVIRAFCYSLPTLGDNEAASILAGVRGRGDYGPALRNWLHESREIFSEQVRVEYPENITDKGIDVYIKGQSSRTAVGFQIKSKGDLQNKDWLQKLKAQITDARAYGNLKLYIVVLACAPEQFMRYQRVLTEELQNWREGTPEILVLTVGRAAALLERCASPLQKAEVEALLSDRSWNSFFADAGAPDRENEFIEKWPSLKPDERFLPPNNFDEIEASLQNNPLTILAGPPLIGKTFTAVQFLWQHYHAGKPVRWIEPMGLGSDRCIIPAVEGTHGWRERTQQLARRLGMQPSQEPLDYHEFVTVQLQPETLILVEDPFGMTDDDYDASLHSYNFFDLDACIKAIIEGSKRSGCRLLLTTRHGLLERWMAEQSTKEQTDSNQNALKIIHLSPDNYERFKSEGDSELVEYAAKLLRARGCAISEDTLEVAKLIGTRIPQEIQFVIQELLPTSTMEDVKGVLSHTQPGAVKRVQYYCQADKDSERLFLFLLLTTAEGEEHNDFTVVYKILHKALQLPGDSTTDDLEARTKYWPLFYQVVYPQRSPNSPFKFGTHLKAAHSSVAEAARKQIGENGDGFLNRLAGSLDRLQTQEHTDEQLRIVSQQLISEHKLLNKESMRLLADVLPNVIKPSYSFDFRSPRQRILNNWILLPDILRSKFFDVVCNGDPRLLADVCESFQYSSLPADVKWKFYRLLTAQQPYLGVTRLSHPWTYFIEHLDEAPADIIEIFDQMAVERPDQFSYVLGYFASQFWDSFHPEWQAAILSDHSKTMAVEQIFSGIFRGDDNECPALLLDQLYLYLGHTKPEFRALAGTYTFFRWNKLPLRFHNKLRNLFRKETEIEVVCQVLQQGMDDKQNAHEIELASIVVERANDVMSALLLSIFLRIDRNERAPQIRNLIEKCKNKGGVYTRAVSLPDIELKDIYDEPDVIKLAYICELINELPPRQPDKTPGTHPADKTQSEAICSLIPLMDQHCQKCAYYILAHREDELHPLLQKFVKTAEQEGNDQVKEAIVLGRKNDAKTRTHNSRRIPNFPLSSFGPLLN